MGTAPGLLPGLCDIAHGGSKLGPASLCILSLFGCCSPAEAGHRLDGRSRFERPALAPCSRWGSKSRPRLVYTAGSRCDCRLLCARVSRECATKRGARTQTSDLADVLAVSRDANAVLCWPGDANRCFSAPRDQKRTTWPANKQAMALAASRLRGPNQTRVRRAWNAGWFHHA